VPSVTTCTGTGRRCWRRPSPPAPGWLEQWPDGDRYLPGLLAQDVQAVVYARVDPLWPLCPTCGDHALFVEPDLGEDAFWVCPRSGLPIAEVGRL